ncbi:MAG: zinc-dependent alcohol dehydrogenase family protein [Chloroflexi bacterium]|nr:zinc-dependent alcohol dehydrogenase family protein [Chloroflexota bacterium]
MKAMQLHAPKPVSDDPLTLVDTAVPDPGSGQIRLKVSACGVCHTDLHTVEGDLELPRLPITPGHEIVGVVEAVGESVTRHKLGDRVGVAWVNWTCGECDYCRRGQENLCPQARFTGLHADGGYAQYVVVDENFAYPLPPIFDDAHAAPLLCAGIVGYRSLRLSGIQPGERLGLYGFGASAHLVIQVARHWDCQVYVFTRSQAHRDHARELGAVWTGGAEDMPPELLDASVTFAPAGWIIPQSLRHLRPGGTIAINAIHMSPIPEMPYHLIYGERVVRSVANFTRYDAEAFLRLAGEIPIQTDVETFSLAEANDVLKQMKASQIRGAAVLEIGD